MDLSWDHFNSSLQGKIHLKTAIWLCWLLRKLTSPTKTKCSFKKLNSPPAQNYACFFPHSPLRQGAMATNLLPVIAPKMKPSYTHSSYLLHGTYTLISTAPFARQLCDDIHFRWMALIAFPARSQTFNPIPASFTHTSSQISHSMS